MFKGGVKEDQYVLMAAFIELNVLEIDPLSTPPMCRWPEEIVPLRKVHSP